MGYLKPGFLISLLVLLNGCAGVVSLHPLALPNDKDVVTDPALAGTWEDAQPQQFGGANRYVVERAESGYSVTTEPDGLRGTMRLLKAKDRLLLDVYCPSNGAPPPVHLFFKVRVEKNHAWLAEMDGNWLQDQIRTRNQLRHEVLSEDRDRIMLTASTTDLRQYLLPYVADDRAFGEEIELKRVE